MTYNWYAKDKDPDGPTPASQVSLTSQMPTPTTLYIARF